MPTHADTHTAAARPRVTDTTIAQLAESIARAASRERVEGVLLAAYLRHLYGGPDPEVAHEVGMRHLAKVNARLRNRGLPAVAYDEHCFRFLS
ncbi:hypothetical protein [Azospirillum sp.]|uniref:hypothetical protein n=1 Tax=Azospirillum sp. TaxID=34012 RepID=UPI002D2E38E9|nr:hypothetical protein [Azospirillum sp.]HYD63965.1 hypothetical protein [Azospirillum sp.]